MASKVRDLQEGVGIDDAKQIKNILSLYLSIQLNYHLRQIRNLEHL